MVNWNSIGEWIIFLWKSCCLRRSKNHNELLQVQSCLNQSVCQAPLIKPEPTGISLEWCLSGNDSLWCVKCRALFFGSCYCDSISPSILCKCINFYSISDEQKRWPFSCYLEKPFKCLLLFFWYGRVIFLHNVLNKMLWVSFFGSFYFL